MRSLFLAALCVSALAQDKPTEKLAPYYPTPEIIVEKMLQLGELKAGEKMFDLGSGDGRIVITAAQKFHAEAVGIEIERDLCKQFADLWVISKQYSSQIGIDIPVHPHRNGKHDKKGNMLRGLRRQCRSENLNQHFDNPFGNSSVHI